MKQQIKLENYSDIKSGSYKLTLIAAFGLSLSSVVFAEEAQNVKENTIQVSMLTLDTIEEQRKEAENPFEEKSVTYVSEVLCE